MTKSFHEDICCDKPTTVGTHRGAIARWFRVLRGQLRRTQGIRRGPDDQESSRQALHRRCRLGPEASSIEYGYRVPFGGIHVFIGKIGKPGLEPDICTDLVETAQRARSARVKPAMKRAFVGVIHGVESEDKSESGGETVVYSGDELSTGET